MNLASSLARAALLVALEGAALLVGGAAYAVAGAVGEPFDRTATVLEGGFAALAGVLVLLVARGLRRRAGWSRAPALVLQLLTLPVGVGLAQGHVWYAAVPVLALALVTLSQLVSRQTASDLDGRS